MKRIICIILTVLLVVGAFPVTAFADCKDYVVVKKDNAPVRTKADNDASVAIQCEEGTLLELVGKHYNWKLNKRSKVRIPSEDKILYIYFGNVKPIKYEITTLKVKGISYTICACGDISASTSSSDKKKEADVVP